MYEREHDRAHETEHATDRDAATPGRANASALLQRREQPAASGILMRKRDGNGVASEAEAAVDAAASSTGSALPAPIQRKFESSLGADLSSVRVHTGSESQNAAAAVGAQAYTVGQDIHFGAGKFDPTSNGGQHLLAHEVAHTVQQSGGASARQNKLEVSSPHDSAEHEADRAADAMIVGSPFQVTGGSAGAARKIHREPSTTVNDGNYQTLMGDGEGREAEAKKENAVNKKEGTMSYLNASNSAERGRAKQLLALVDQGIAELNTAQVDDKQSEVGKMLAQNKAAQAQLVKYTEVTENQEAMQSQVEPELKKCNIQYAKLEGMWASASTSLGIKSDSGEFDAKRASDIAKGGDAYEFDSKQKIQEQAVYTGPGTPGKVKAQDSQIGVCKANISRLQDELLGLPKELGVAASHLKASHGKVNAAAALVRLPPPVLQPDDNQKAQQDQIKKAKGEFDQAVAIINTAASLAVSGAQKIPLGGGGGGPAQVGTPGTNVDFIHEGNGYVFGESVPGGTVVNTPNTQGSAGDVAKAKSIMDTAGGIDVGKLGGVEFGFVEGVADALTQYTLKVKSAESMIGAVTDANTKASMQQAAAALNGVKEELQANLKEIRRVKVKMEATKALLRDQVEKLMTLIDGNKTKDGKGPDYGVVIAFQSEATIFLAQVDATLELGKVERAAAREVNPNVKSAPKTEAPAEAHNITNSQDRGAPYWSAYKLPLPGQDKNDKDKKTMWDYTRHTVFITSNGQGPMDENMDKVMGTLEADKIRVQGFVAKLKSFTGL